MDSSENQYKVNNINVEEIIGEGSIVSNSPLFTARIQATEDNNHTVMMERKSFNDVVSGDLGVVLEKITITQRIMKSKIKCITL